MTEPRPHHYQFAHRILPGWFFHDPEKFLSTCVEDGLIFIHWLWERAGEDLEDVTEPVGLAFEKIKRAGTTALVITCPEPIGMTEAYFVVLVVPKKGKARVFTLEHSFDLEEIPIAVSCEWTDDKKHLNKGQLDVTDREVFIEYVFNTLVPKN